jgi:hypothetical protein
MRRVWTILALGLLSLGLLPVAAAQSQGSPIASPAQLTAAGVRGERLTRTTLIRADTALSELQASATDLTSQRGVAILASAITVQLPADQLATGAVLAVTVTIDLAAIPSGDYSGELILNYNAGALVLPITVQVKHPWWWGLPVLVFGVGFGGALTYYRQQVQPYDDILIRAGRLRTHMRNDADLADAFAQAVERHLADSEAALQSANLDQARLALGQAETVWQRWRRHKPNWQEQFAYVGELQKTLETTAFPSDTPYIRRVQQNLRDALRDAPAMEQGAVELETRLQEQQQAVERYQKLYAELHRVMGEVDPRGRGDQPERKQRAAALEKRLFSLDPGHADGLNLLEQEINTLSAELANQPPMQGDIPNEVLGGGRGVKDIIPVINLPLAPSLTPVSTSEAQANQAVTRRQWTGLLSSVFILVLLALVGFGQIYGDNPTFGANIWIDYATLLAWGFGVETTRASILGLGRVT